MGIVEDLRYQPLLEDDPDDYRPQSQLAFAIDPGRRTAPASTPSASCSNTARPASRVPLHTHTLDEAVVVDEGALELTLGDERHTVSAGSVVFIPAGQRHSRHNRSRDVVPFHGIFPRDVIDIAYLERNPAPGTEDQPPQAPFSTDLRALA